MSVRPKNDPLILAALRYALAWIRERVLSCCVVIALRLRSWLPYRIEFVHDVPTMGSGGGLVLG